MTDTVYDLVEKVIDFYGNDEKKWCKQFTALDKDGFGVGSLNPNAVCWCLYGAVRKISSEYSDFSMTEDVASEALTTISYILHGQTIIFFNDHHEFDDVMGFLHLALVKYGDALKKISINNDNWDIGGEEWDNLRKVLKS